MFLANQITDLPNNIDNLFNLTKLCINDNRIKSLPDAIGKLKKLEELSTYNNPLTTLPECILQLNQLRAFQWSIDFCFEQLSPELQEFIDRFEQENDGFLKT